MLKKFVKMQSIKTYYPSSDLSGHIFLFGRVGSGKSVSGKTVCEGYHDNKGYKIWDDWGGERDEHLFWSIPSQEESYWTKFYSLGTFDEKPQKQYKVNFLYPYFESKLPKKLPKKEGIVTSKIFTIPLKEITYEDVGLVMNNLSETTINAWQSIQDECKKTYNSGTLEFLSDKLKVDKSGLLYTGFIAPMIKEKLLSDSYNDNNIDLVSEAKDRETITILCTEFVPKKFKIFVLNWYIRKLNELIDENKIPKKNIHFIREASAFFKTDLDAVLEDRLKRFRAYMTKYLQMGRRGNYFMLDVQSYSEVKGFVQSSEDYMMMFKTTSPSDKDAMCSELKRDKRMREDQIADLSFLEQGQCYIYQTGEHQVQKTQMILPRSAFWTKKYGNFYKNVWEKFGGAWMSTEETKDYINSKLYVLHYDRKTKTTINLSKKENVEEIDIVNINNEKVNPNIVQDIEKNTEQNTKQNAEQIEIKRLRRYLPA